MINTTTSLLRRKDVFLSSFNAFFFLLFRVEITQLFKFGGDSWWCGNDSLDICMADKCVGGGMGIFYIGMAFGEDTQKIMLDKCLF